MKHGLITEYISVGIFGSLLLLNTMNTITNTKRIRACNRASMRAHSLQMSLALHKTNL